MNRKMTGLSMKRADGESSMGQSVLYSGFWGMVGTWAVYRWEERYTSCGAKGAEDGTNILASVASSIARMENVSKDHIGISSSMPATDIVGTFEA